MSWYQRVTFLLKTGLTNYDQEDFANIQMSKTMVIRTAFCSSHECNPKVRDKNGRIIRTYKYIEKKVRPGASSCPDCGTFLFWEVGRSKQSQNMITD